MKRTSPNPRVGALTRVGLMSVPANYNVFYHSSGSPTKINATLHTATTMTPPRRPLPPQKEGRLALATTAI